MKRLAVLMAAVMLPLTTWAQSAQDFASHFMQGRDNGSNVKCITVGPKMISTMLSSENPSEDTAGLREALEGIKSLRIISGTTEASALRKEAVGLLKRSRRHYSPYKENGKQTYGDCLWTRQIGKRIAELVYVAPENTSKGFVVMDFTGNIDPGFIEGLISKGQQK